MSGGNLAAIEAQDQNEYDTGLTRWELAEYQTVPATKTYMAKKGEIDRQWWVVDGAGAVVGRLASQIATILMGKHRPTYTPHVDTGDFVVVTNVEKVEFSGNKWTTKTYARYSGYPGLKIETAESLRGRIPERVLREAVRRMLPKNKLGRQMLSKLKLYAGDEHPHQAQQPQPLEPAKRL